MKTWNGIYSKRIYGNTEFVNQPEQGVTIVNGLGGAGITLSFGLAEEIIESMTESDYSNSLETIK